MANIVEAKGFKIFIDPGAALAPYRYGLPPHEIELNELEKSIEKICKNLNDSNLIVITHFHRDHYLSNDYCIEAFKNKTIIMKHPEIDINYSQKMRAKEFIKKTKDISKLIFTNGEDFVFEGIKMKISFPLWHGSQNTPLGKVLVILIDDEEQRYLFASDTQGPGDDEAARWIINNKPTIVYISGPPYYLIGSIKGVEEVENGEKNLEKIFSINTLNTIIIDHHFAREKNYVNRLERLRINYNQKIKITDAAEFMGVERNPLESNRDELYNRKLHLSKQ
ncbi:MBL fold metallo-hydrolase [Fervidicoccus fontis]|uniref:UPF0282 protein ENO39_01950 n=1 Tax=Fervidicoccus fontis TaxID=683846 RepID=A0A7C2ZAG6_9CREN|nr:MBL fold metallo-hydrolase [Fervidicoccus fontis]PMB76756.1 MAG: hypothetical protein C0177_05300 [Fervidicoccus fontis]HEW63809.1 MBL fold metallo-hydrolase [Fervidicoccus fontis]